MGIKKIAPELGDVRERVVRAYNPFRRWNINGKKCKLTFGTKLFIVEKYDFYGGWYWKTLRISLYDEPLPKARVLKLVK